jgi:hypothetical protein
MNSWFCPAENPNQYHEEKGGIRYRLAAARNSPPPSTKQHIRNSKREKKDGGGAV